MTARPAKSNQGFILPLVLWMIAALALIAAVLGQWAKHLMFLKYVSILKRVSKLN